MSTYPRLFVQLGLCLALGAAGAATAAPVPPAQTTDTPQPAAATDAAADPATLEHPIALRDDAAMTLTVLPDGTRSAVLDASFLSTSVARFDAEGRVVIGCVSTREEYDAFFAAEAMPDGLEVR